MNIKAHRINRVWTVYVAQGGHIGTASSPNYTEALADALQDLRVGEAAIRLLQAAGVQ